MAFFDLLKSTERSRCFMFLIKGECLTWQALLFTYRVCSGGGESGVVAAVQQPDAFPWGRLSWLFPGERKVRQSSLLVLANHGCVQACGISSHFGSAAVNLNTFMVTLK